MIYRLDLFSFSTKHHTVLVEPEGATTTLTWHANAAKSARIVEAAALVLARMGLALVDVGLAARTGEALGTVAREGPGRVHADAVMLARGTWNGEKCVSVGQS